MGARGPAPFPIEQRIANGETERRRINYTAPVPHGTPIKPPDLDAAASKVWDRVLEDAPAGMLTSLDTEAIRLYCEAVSRYVVAQRIYNEAPLVRSGWFMAWDDEAKAEVRRPLYVKNPIHQVLRDNAEMVRMFARELGFTPSARVNLHIQAASGTGVLPFDQTIGLPARARLSLVAGSSEEDV